MTSADPLHIFLDKYVYFVNVLIPDVDVTFFFQRQSYTQKSQECQALRTELNRLRVVATTLGPLPPPSSQSQRATSPPPPSPAAPPYTPPANSPLSRFNSVHVRSASMHVSSRSATPTPQSIRSYTTTPMPRSHTSMSMRSPSGPNTLRAQTPAPPPIPPKPRRLSHPSPPKMNRSISEEKQEVHERWLPPGDTYKSKYGPLAGGTPTKISRTSSYLAASATTRFRDTRSPSPS